MTTILVQDILDWFEEWAPVDTAAPWDNCGLQIGHVRQEVQGIYLSLDIDAYSLNFLKKAPHDLSITHHPIFFSPLKRLDYLSETGQIIQQFCQQNASLISHHTNLDIAVGGVTDCLVEAFGFSMHDTDVFGEAHGRKLTLDTSVSLDKITSMHPGNIVGKRPEQIKTIAFGGGSGSSLIKACAADDIDLLITGELGYHQQVTCDFLGVSAYCLGHAESERFVLAPLAKKLASDFPSLTLTVDPRALPG